MTNIEKWVEGLRTNKEWAYNVLLNSIDDDCLECPAHAECAKGVANRCKEILKIWGKKKVTNIEKFIKDHKNEGFTHESGIVRRLDDFETLLNCGFCPVVNVCRLHEDMSYPTAENCIVTFMKWGAEEIEE